MFRKSLHLAQADEHAEIYILSAKHGVVGLRDVLEPYDVTLKTMAAVERHRWGVRVEKQLRKLRSKKTEVVVMAGRPYVAPIEAFLEREFARVYTPLMGLGIGRRLSWMQRAGHDVRAAVDLEELYQQLWRIESHLGGRVALSQLGKDVALPSKGVYFFFEPGELRTDGKPRIVRVGTHAVSAGSKATLRARLRTHLGTSSGSGSHRSSVFRRHVGVAIARQRGMDLPPTWGVGQTATPEVRSKEEWLEHEVSLFMAQTTVLWLAVPDESGPDSDRAYLERHAIALLVRAAFMYPPSHKWTGRFSDRSSIIQSGIWNVDHTDRQYDPQFIDVLRHYVNRTVEVSSSHQDPPMTRFAPDGWRNRRARPSEEATLW
jgi:hypothetical protein